MWKRETLCLTGQTAPLPNQRSVSCMSSLCVEDGGEPKPDAIYYISLLTIIKCITCSIAYSKVKMVWSKRAKKYIFGLKFDLLFHDIHIVTTNLVSSLQLPNGLGRGEARIMRPLKQVTLCLNTCLLKPEASTNVSAETPFNWRLRSACRCPAHLKESLECDEPWKAPQPYGTPGHGTSVFI